jgi:hypothetical protein
MDSAFLVLFLLLAVFSGFNVVFSGFNCSYLLSVLISSKRKRKAIHVIPGPALA